MVSTHEIGTKGLVAAFSDCEIFANIAIGRLQLYFYQIKTECFPLSSAGPGSSAQRSARRTGCARTGRGAPPRTPSTRTAAG